MLKIKILIVVILTVFNTGIRCFAQDTSASQIQRTQELLEKEKVLRQKLEQEEKVFIKKIIVTGVTLLTVDQVEEIITPFQNHWLSKDEIQGILDTIKLAYQQKGFVNQLAKISVQIKKYVLKIKVDELTH